MTVEIQTGLLSLQWTAGPLTANWNVNLMELQWTTGPLTTTADGS
jgi:hypothetical protein